jgi:sec-independent protein translocase protein TatB
MFDISWSEFLLIGVVALIVIGPKELPAVMRTLGQWTRKVRSMATEFQNQFQEAMREAEMTDLKEQVDDLARDVKNFDPLKDVRSDVESVGEDVKRSLASSEPAAAGAEPALAETPVDTPPPALETASTASSETPAPALPEVPAEQPARQLESLGSAAATPQSADKAAPTDATEPTE